VFDAFMGLPEGAVEFMHGYTYSAHPLACAAAAATIDVYKDQGLFERAGRIAPVWEGAVHSLRGAAPDVIDIRNHGILAAIELAPRAPGQPSRAGAVSQHAYENGVLVRLAGDALVLSPPLIIEESQIGQIVDTIGQALKAVA
jgi:beta-alanine--pyruvate transaminase